jgi:hypothetical protein
MSCSKLESWVMAEGAGNLPSALMEHAAACERCRRLIEDVRVLDRTLSGLSLPDPGESYWEALPRRIANRLDEPMTVVSWESRPPAWQRVVSRVWAPAVAIALLAVIASRQSLDTVSPTTVSTAAPHVSVSPQPGRQLPIPANGVLRSYDDATVNPQSGSAARNNTPALKAQPSPRSALRNGDGSSYAGSGSAGTAKKELSSPVESPTVAVHTPPVSGPAEDVWPERQITIMGKVDSNLPAQSLSDEKQLTTQDAYSTYERQMAQAEQGTETAGTFGTPGRLMAGSSPAVVGRGGEGQTPVDKMRQFDEMAELHDLIARLGTIPAASRTTSQWTQLSTAWFRLGMISDHPGVIDSALAAVTGYMVNGVLDSTQLREWDTRKTQLENRRRTLRP